MTVAGDCAVAGLGLSLTDRQTLVSNISIIFHAAATIKFDESLKLAVDINVHGTKDVIELAKETKHLKVINYSQRNSKTLESLNKRFVAVFHSCVNSIFKLPSKLCRREVLRLSDGL